MESVFRRLSLASGLFFVVVAVGFALRTPWAARLWPFAMLETRLGFIFLTSIAAAIAAPLIWIGLTGEVRAAQGGAVNLSVTSLGWGAFTIWLTLRGGRSDLTWWTVGALVLTGLSLYVLVFARRFPWHDTRPMPLVVRISFAAFGAVLTLTAAALLVAYPTVFPWPLARESSVMYGWIFLGAATYFAYGWLRPYWANAAGQLYGFLAYDLVLIVPFVKHFAAVRPDHRLSLIIYTIVLIYSGALAVYYLFATRRTDTVAGS